MRTILSYGYCINQKSFLFWSIKIYSAKFISLMVFYAILIISCIVIFLGYKYSAPDSKLVAGGIPVSNVLSHWSHFFQAFSMPSDTFYNELENTLRVHEMPHSTIFRTKHKEGGILSASREYLRIKHGDIVFDVCASPFGRNFFISWWLYETAGTMRTVLKNTRVGNFLQNRAQQRTFYQIDEEAMFRSCVHECILETINKVSEGKGMLSLTDSQKAFKMGGL